MKVKVCLRCDCWIVNNLMVRTYHKAAIITLCDSDIISVDFEKIVCLECRQEIGNDLSETLLKSFEDENIGGSANGAFGSQGTGNKSPN